LTVPLILLLLSATIGGLVLARLGVPGGLVIGGLIGAAAYQLIRGGGAPVEVPGPLRTAAFLVLGAAIGSTITRDTVSGLRGVLLPAVLAAVLIIGAGVVIALGLRVVGIAPPGDVLATSPGALSAIAAVAAERGTGPAEVALFHTVRVVLVLLSLPLLLTLLPEPGD
jgi:membrane AbrB-like protein